MQITTMMNSSSSSLTNCDSVNNKKCNNSNNVIDCADFDTAISLTGTYTINCI